MMCFYCYNFVVVIVFISNFLYLDMDTSNYKSLLWVSYCSRVSQHRNIFIYLYIGEILSYAFKKKIILELELKSYSYRRNV